MNVLSLNPGSSSLKFALHAFDASGEDRRLIRGALERLGTSEALLNVVDERGRQTEAKVGSVRLTNAVKHAVEQCEAVAKIDAVGCRVVHGGARFSQPALIDDDGLQAIRALSPLAPLHNARDVETIEGARKVLGEVPVVAVFDTAFHATLPPEAYTYALPKELIKQYELRRYGFHGISYRYVAHRLIAKLGDRAQKLIVCHLGNGASVCAIRDGKSIDTSMGMTPLEGLVMGTRSGDLDPGLILFLEREQHIHMRELDSILNSRSGLAGLSGLSGDVRELEQAANEGNPDANLALEVFAYRIAKYIGAYAVSLDGLDALAFCGGIGEHSACVREKVCRRLTSLGIRLNDKNTSPVWQDALAQIDANTTVSVWAVQTDEERQIAIETQDLLPH
jgi:acetate kinase